MIITISRETGSSGHTIGKMLADRLGYDFYDKELIPLVAKKCISMKRQSLKMEKTCPIRLT